MSTGTTREIPRIWVLRMVHRHRAASASTKPVTRLQHWFTGEVFTFSFTRLRAVKQAPIFKVSVGQ